ncbi:MAG: rhomboid family intramembrane serine protease [Candidatus Woesearchaeota archaeon]
MIKKILLWPGTQIAIICIAIFILVANAVNLLGFSGELFKQGEFWRMITFPFTHLDFSHLVENVVTLGIVSFLSYEIGLNKNQFLFVFFGANLVLALTNLLFLPLIIIAGASAGIFAILGSISIKGSEFVPQFVLFPLMFSSIFIKSLFSLFSGAAISWTMVLMHTLGFVYGVGIYLLIIRYKPKSRRILQLE